jgi:hypothetical protein
MEGKANSGHVNVLGSHHSLAIEFFLEKLRRKVKEFL